MLSFKRSPAPQFSNFIDVNPIPLSDAFSLSENGLFMRGNHCVHELSTVLSSFLLFADMTRVDSNLALLSLVNQVLPFHSLYIVFQQLFTFVAIHFSHPFRAIFIFLLT